MIAWRLEYKGQWKLQVYICRTRLGLKSPVCHFVDNYTDTPKIQYNAIQCNTIQYNTIQYNTPLLSDCNAMQCNTINIALIDLPYAQKRTHIVTLLGGAHTVIFAKQ